MRIDPDIFNSAQGGDTWGGLSAAVVLGRLFTRFSKVSSCDSFRPAKVTCNRGRKTILSSKHRRHLAMLFAAQAVQRVSVHNRHQPCGRCNDVIDYRDVDDVQFGSRRVKYVCALSQCVSTLYNTMLTLSVACTKVESPALNG